MTKGITKYMYDRGYFLNFHLSWIKFLSVCQKRFNKLKNINISKTSYQNDFYYTRVPGFSGIGRTKEGTRLQDHLCEKFAMSYGLTFLPQALNMLSILECNMRALASSLWYNKILLSLELCYVKVKSLWFCCSRSSLFSRPSSYLFYLTR
jgi:hypothetical protein